MEPQQEPTPSEHQQYTLQTNNENDSEEDDEDYDPVTDKQDDDDADDDEPMVEDDTNKNQNVLSTQQHQAYQQAVSSLFGTTQEEEHQEEVTNQESIPSYKKQPNAKKRGKQKQTKSKRAILKKRRILTDLFGMKTADKMIRVHLKKINQENTGGKKILISSLPKIQKKVVTEVKSFAGQEITVQTVVNTCSSNIIPKVTNESHATSVAAPPPPPPQLAKKSALDSVISTLSGETQKLSTVAKTSADWDAFKEKSGLDEDFENQAIQGKSSFLVKQDFLQRVDVRRFEHEKADRDKKRAANGI